MIFFENVDVSKQKFEWVFSELSKCMKVPTKDNSPYKWFKKILNRCNTGSSIYYSRKIVANYKILMDLY